MDTAALDAANDLYATNKAELEETLDKVTHVLTYLVDRGKTEIFRTKRDQLEALWRALPVDALESRTTFAQLMGKLADLARDTLLDANGEPKVSEWEEIAGVSASSANAIYDEAAAVAGGVRDTVVGAGQVAIGGAVILGLVVILLILKGTTK